MTATRTETIEDRLIQAIEWAWYGLPDDAYVPPPSPLIDNIIQELLNNVDEQPTLKSAANDAWNQAQALIEDLERIQAVLLRLEKE